MDIMKLVAGAITPVAASKLAGTLGISEGIARKVVAVGIPVILAAIMKRGAAPGGTDAISSAMAGMGKNPLGDLNNIFGGDASKVTAAGKNGTDLLSSILGSQESSSLVSKLAGYAGGDKAAVGTLLGLAGSTALGGLKSAADEQKLDAAGVMRLLGGQKDQIAKAIPADLGRTLASTGLMPSDIVSAATSTQFQQAPQEKSGMMKWIIGLAALAVLVWLASQFLGGGQDEVTTTTEAPAAATVNPLEVEGVDIGQSVQGILTDLTGSLAGITDTESAQSALETLTSADQALGGLEGAIGSLTGEGKSALSGLVNGSLPALQSTVEGLLGDGGIATILKPVLDSILSKLTAFAG
jgi:hypothetical protein